MATAIAEPVSVAPATALDEQAQEEQANMEEEGQQLEAQAEEAPALPSRSRTASTVPLAACLSVGAVLVAAKFATKLLRRKRREAPALERRAEVVAVTPVATAAATPAETTVVTPVETPVAAQAAAPEISAMDTTASTDVAPAKHAALTAAAQVDLSPFGSPVGGTPQRVKGIKTSLQGTPSKAAPAAIPREEDDRSDKDSLRDQRLGGVVDAKELARTLKEMQQMQEENRKLQAFLTEHKANAEKLSKLEQENRELRDVTRVLEQELQDVKASTRPLVNSGAELERFKSGISAMGSVARSTCSNDEGLGVSTASVDGGTLDANRKRASLFKQLVANLTLSNSTTPRGSQPPTPRNGSQTSRKPAPEEAAALGQAVYQLLDTFGGKLM